LPDRRRGNLGKNFIARAKQFGFAVAQNKNFVDYRQYA
jgi:hypothetical protein